MARISTYERDEVINPGDELIGTDIVDGGTKNFTFDSIAEYLLTLPGFAGGGTGGNPVTALNFTRSGNRITATLSLTSGAPIVASFVDNLSDGVIHSGSQDPVTSQVDGFAGDFYIRTDASTTPPTIDFYGPLLVNAAAGTYAAWNAVGPISLSGGVGVEGPQGPMGDPGMQGDPGMDGATGPQGDPGAQGPIGLPGAAGIDGTDGTDGTDGMDGAMGLMGDEGADGAAGPQGPFTIDVFFRSDTITPLVSPTVSSFTFDDATGQFVLDDANIATTEAGVTWVDEIPTGTEQLYESRAIFNPAGTGPGRLSDFSVPFAAGSAGPQGLTGLTGAAGRGITSIAFAFSNNPADTTTENQAGFIDTYTITYSDATTFLLEIRNGSDGADGTAGAVGATGQDGYRGADVSNPRLDTTTGNERNLLLDTTAYSLGSLFPSMAYIYNPSGIIEIPEPGEWTGYSATLAGPNPTIAFSDIGLISVHVDNTFFDGLLNGQRIAVFVDDLNYGFYTADNVELMRANEDRLQLTMVAGSTMGSVSTGDRASFFLNVGDATGPRDLASPTTTTVSLPNVVGRSGTQWFSSISGLTAGAGVGLGSITFDGIEDGDYILVTDGDTRGDIFFVSNLTGTGTGRTATLGLEGNIRGPEGTEFFTTATQITAATTDFSEFTDLVNGDIILVTDGDAAGNLFTITTLNPDRISGILTASGNIRGAVGLRGVRGATWFTTTIQGFITGPNMDVSTFTDIVDGDFILVTTGANAGDIFQVSDVVGTAATFTLQGDISGPDGEDGATWFTTLDQLLDGIGMDVSGFPDIANGDYILVTEGDAGGDIHIVSNLSADGNTAELELVGNIRGPIGVSGLSLVNITGVAVSLPPDTLGADADLNIYRNITAAAIDVSTDALTTPITGIAINSASGEANDFELVAIGLAPVTLAAGALGRDAALNLYYNSTAAGILVSTTALNSPIAGIQINLAAGGTTTTTIASDNVRDWDRGSEYAISPADSVIFREQIFVRRNNIISEVPDIVPVIGAPAGENFDGIGNDATDPFIFANVTRNAAGRVTFNVRWRQSRAIANVIYRVYIRYIENGTETLLQFQADEEAFNDVVTIGADPRDWEIILIDENTGNAPLGISFVGSVTVPSTQGVFQANDELFYIVQSPASGGFAIAVPNEYPIRDTSWVQLSYQLGTTENTALEGSRLADILRNNAKVGTTIISATPANLPAGGLGIDDNLNLYYNNTIAAIPVDTSALTDDPPRIGIVIVLADDGELGLIDIPAAGETAVSLATDELGVDADFNLYRNTSDPARSIDVTAAALTTPITDISISLAVSEETGVSIFTTSAQLRDETSVIATDFPGAGVNDLILITGGVQSGIVMIVTALGANLTIERQQLRAAAVDVGIQETALGRAILNIASANSYELRSDLVILTDNITPTSLGTNTSQIRFDDTDTVTSQAGAALSTLLSVGDVLYISQGNTAQESIVTATAAGAIFVQATEGGTGNSNNEIISTAPVSIETFGPAVTDGASGVRWYTTALQTLMSAVSQDLSGAEFTGIANGDIILVSSGENTGSLFTVSDYNATLMTATLTDSGSIRGADGVPFEETALGRSIFNISSANRYETLEDLILIADGVIPTADSTTSIITLNATDTVASLGGVALSVLLAVGDVLYITQGAISQESVVTDIDATTITLTATEGGILNTNNLIVAGTAIEAERFSVLGSGITFTTIPRLTTPPAPVPLPAGAFGRDRLLNLYFNTTDSVILVDEGVLATPIAGIITNSERGGTTWYTTNLQLVPGTQRLASIGDVQTGDFILITAGALAGNVYFASAVDEFFVGTLFLDGNIRGAVGTGISIPEWDRAVPFSATPDANEAIYLDRIYARRNTDALAVLLTLVAGAPLGTDGTGIGTDTTDAFRLANVVRDASGAIALNVEWNGSVDIDTGTTYQFHIATSEGVIAFSTVADGTNLTDFSGGPGLTDWIARVQNADGTTPAGVTFVGTPDLPSVAGTFSAIREEVSVYEGTVRANEFPSTDVNWTQLSLELGTTAGTALEGNTTVITDAQADAITANTAKIGLTAAISNVPIVLRAGEFGYDNRLNLYHNTTAADIPNVSFLALTNPIEGIEINLSDGIVDIAHLNNGNILTREVYLLSDTLERLPVDISFIHVNPADNTMYIRVTGIDDIRDFFVSAESVSPLSGARLRIAVTSQNVPGNGVFDFYIASPDPVVIPGINTNDYLFNIRGVFNVDSAETATAIPGISNLDNQYYISNGVVDPTQLTGVNNPSGRTFATPSTATNSVFFTDDVVVTYNLAELLPTFGDFFTPVFDAPMMSAIPPESVGFDAGSNIYRNFTQEFVSISTDALTTPVPGIAINRAGFALGTTAGTALEGDNAAVIALNTAKLGITQIVPPVTDPPTPIMLAPGELGADMNLNLYRNISSGPPTTISVDAGRLLDDPAVSGIAINFASGGGGGGGGPTPPILGSMNARVGFGGSTITDAEATAFPEVGGSDPILPNVFGITNTGGFLASPLAYQWLVIDSAHTLLTASQGGIGAVIRTPVPITIGTETFNAYSFGDDDSLAPTGATYNYIATYS